MSLNRDKELDQEGPVGQGEALSYNNADILKWL